MGVGKRGFRSLLSPLFVASAVLLCAAGAGIRPAATAVAARLDKLPITPRRALKELDIAALPSFRPGTWEFLAEGLDQVGTADVISVALEDWTPGADRQSAGLFITYYADPHTKVPHTPDVCYRQSGAIVHGQRTIHVDVPDLGQSGERIAVNVLRVDSSRGKLLLLYLFCSNGRFCTDRQAVRLLLNWPGERFAYFSKIEIFALCGSDAEEPRALETSMRLLREALPVLLREHFPDAVALRGP